MKIEFQKRTKKQNKAEIEENLDQKEEEGQPNTDRVINKAHIQLSNRVRPSGVISGQVSNQENALSRKFEEQRNRNSDLTQIIEEKKIELTRLQESTLLNFQNPNKLVQTPPLHNLANEEDIYLSKLVEHEQRIMKEANEKPMWSAGITEVEISQLSRLENINKCENLLLARLNSVVHNKLFKHDIPLIPEEDVIARGGIWANPKKLTRVVPDIKQKIKKSLTSVFAKKNKVIAFALNPKLKTE
jgi:hypothetical protein